jgi:predicted hydrolase (HD superfamily)/phosphoribosyl-ATP pyrophosphohydrolase
MQSLLKLAKFLRDPHKGCPWDRDQTLESFKQNVVNEANEVVEAIVKKDSKNLCEEVGDTLFNLAFITNLAEEQGLFTLDNVIEAIFYKLLHRHPHVFGEASAGTASEALGVFMKAKEAHKQMPPLNPSLTRADAWQLLCRYTEGDSLRKHALAVETAMAACAGKFGEAEEKWRMAGLLHDLDYEKFPDHHPFTAVYLLIENGYSESIRRAVLCHVEERTGFTPHTPLEKSLCAVDELCGFAIAVALVRPSKKLEDVTPESLLKKMKDKAFARNVDRRAIMTGAMLLDTTLEEHLRFVLEALKPKATELGV